MISEFKRKLCAARMQETQTGFRIKWLVLFYDFKQIWNPPTNFDCTCQDQISWNPLFGLQFTCNQVDKYDEGNRRIFGNIYGER
jgi:hypothetical protein